MNLTHETTRPALRGGRLVVLLLAVIGLLFTASSARAGCGDPFKSQNALRLPWVGHQDDNDQGSRPTIVGLWHLHYTASDGSPFVESFKTWHADGTEFENAFLPPVGGNICFGVWKQIAPRTVKLHHVGLMFNPDGTIHGSFTVDEVDTVAEDNKTYQGNFDFKVYDPNGNQVAEVKGTTAGTRITVD